MSFSSFLWAIGGACLLAGCGASVSGGDGAAGGATTSGGTTTTMSASTTSASTTSGTGGAPPTCPDPASPAVFEVGTGLECFARLSPMETVPTIQGPQGGFHLWLSVGCADCPPQTTLEYGVVDPATGTWVEGTSSSLAVVGLDPSGWHQISGLQARLPGAPWDETSQLPKGTHVRLSAAVLDDASNKIHEAQVEVVLGDVEPWYPACDENPMTCGAPGGLPCCTFGGG